MKKNIKELGGNEVIHCPTQEIYKKCLELNNNTSKPLSSWEKFREATCYNPHIKRYDQISWYESKEYKIYQPHEIEGLTEESEKVKACRHYLEQLPEPYRTQALSQMDEEWIDVYQPAESKEEAIMVFADGEETKEGSDYWNNVYKTLEDGEELPTEESEDLPKRGERARFWDEAPNNKHELFFYGKCNDKYLAFFDREQFDRWKNGSFFKIAEFDSMERIPQIKVEINGELKSVEELNEEEKQLLKEML